MPKKPNAWLYMCGRSGWAPGYWVSRRHPDWISSGRWHTLGQEYVDRDSAALLLGQPLPTEMKELFGLRNGKVIGRWEMCYA